MTSKENGLIKDAEGFHLDRDSSLNLGWFEPIKTQLFSGFGQTVAVKASKSFLWRPCRLTSSEMQDTLCSRLLNGAKIYVLKLFFPHKRKSCYGRI